MDVALSIIDSQISLSLENGDLKIDKGLETAVLISLFSDQRVIEEELPPGITDKKGWWGDMFPEVVNDEIGSKIWSLDRNKNNIETVAQLETKAKEALQWMIEDGVAISIDVVSSLDTLNREKSDSSITITRPSGEQDKFGIIWDEQEIRRA